MDKKVIEQYLASMPETARESAQIIVGFIQEKERERRKQTRNAHTKEK